MQDCGDGKKDPAACLPARLPARLPACCLCDFPPCCPYTDQHRTPCPVRNARQVEGGGIVVMLLKNMDSLKQLYTLTMVPFVAS